MNKKALAQMRAEVGTVQRSNAFRAWLSDVDPLYRAKARALFESIYVSDASTYLDLFYVLAYLQEKSFNDTISNTPLDPAY